jgi:DNA-binding MarR family transcriptional regulator
MARRAKGRKGRRMREKLMKERKEASRPVATRAEVSSNDSHHMNNNSREYKKLSRRARDKLDNLSIADDVNALFGAYVEGHDQRGLKGDPLWSWLSDSFPELRTVTVRDREDAEKILEQEYKRVKKENATPEVQEIPSEAFEKADQLLKSGRVLDFIADVIGRVHFGDRDLVKLLWLSAAAIKQNDRIHWLLVGTPGSGKSDLARKVLRLLPKEHKEKLDDCSPKALYYAQEAGINLEQHVICFDDVEPDSGTVKFLKAIGTDDRDELNKWTVDERRKFQEMKIPEAIVAFVTTIQSLTDQQGQLLRRYQIVNPDESKEALAGIGEMIKRAARLPFEITDPAFEQDVLTARAIYKRIVQEDLKVAIPFDFEYKLEKHADKTTLKAFIALVKAHALVNFADRVRIGPVILATEADLEAAGNLWRSTRALKIDETAERVLECLPRREPLLDAEIEQGEETDLANFDRKDEDRGLYRASDIAEHLQLAPRTVQDKLKNLYDAGLIDRKRTELQGRPWVCWRVDSGASTKMARVNEETYEQEVRYTLKTFTDQYGGDAEALYIIIEQNRNKQFRHSEEPDRKTESNKNVPRPSAQDTGSAGNGGTSGEIERPFAHLTSFSAPRKKSASFNERGQQEGAAIITAESQLHIEHVEIGHQNSDLKANTVTPHTTPKKYTKMSAICAEQER